MYLIVNFSSYCTLASDCLWFSVLASSVDFCFVSLYLGILLGSCKVLLWELLEMITESLHHQLESPILYFSYLLCLLFNSSLK